MSSQRIIDRLTEDLLQDEYLASLLLKIETINALRFFKNPPTELLTDKEYIDLLRFADILSNSDEPKARNEAYQIISLLLDDYVNEPRYKTVSTAVLAKLGNFPALQYLKDNNNYSVELPFERELEKEIKTIEQAVPGTDGSIFTDVQFELFERLRPSDICFSVLRRKVCQLSSDSSLRMRLWK